MTVRAYEPKRFNRCRLNAYKKQWSSAARARKAALSASITLGKIMRAYRCECGAWHLTSKRVGKSAALEAAKEPKR